MLVIRRRLGESLLVGADIEIEVLEISANRVKLGVKAPKQVRVLRGEVKLTREQNVIASASSPDSVSSLLQQIAITKEP